MDELKEKYRYRYCEFAVKLIGSLSEKLCEIIQFNPDILDLVSMNSTEEATMPWVKRMVKIHKAMKLMETNNLVTKPFFSPV